MHVQKVADHSYPHPVFTRNMVTKGTGKAFQAVYWGGVAKSVPILHSAAYRTAGLAAKAAFGVPVLGYAGGALLVVSFAPTLAENLPKGAKFVNHLGKSLAKVVLDDYAMAKEEIEGN